VLNLPTDVSEFLAEVDLCQKLETKAESSGPKRPCCVKKIALDVVENLSGFQAAKYCSTTKLKRAKQQLRAAKANLKELMDGEAA